MSKPDPKGSGDGVEYRDEPVAEILSEMTGRPASEFEAVGNVEYPHPDELETVPEDEW